MNKKIGFFFFMIITGYFSIAQSQMPIRPALIPNPQKIEWANELFKIEGCDGIFISNDSLIQQAIGVKKYLQNKGFYIPITKTKQKNKAYIDLIVDHNIESINEANTEAYSLKITQSTLVLEAISKHGIFNGIQTLFQLVKGGGIQACTIKDWPSFTWRGYMIDVGRNFQSIQQIKSQIDVMARYKLNVFHFHLTEDIAWRLQSNLYPKLNLPEFMMRNKGQYYTFEQVRDLVNYCKERYITFLPEIDMPGHSAAFNRALGVEMQSEQGVEICKNLINELCNEIDVPMIHIGGDEVVIKNNQFLPIIVELLKKHNKKVVAWNPGGNVPNGTILQMWNGRTKPKENYYSVDSRHLYLNHFDPQEGVVTTYNHIICDVKQGDASHLGATLCNWPDRNVANEKDLIKMNAVYPIMLAFAERCWMGGGISNYTSDMGLPGDASYIAFREFEDRLLSHKHDYFSNQFFPYVQQSNLDWNIVGPFNNQGNTKTVFYPEQHQNIDTLSNAIYKKTRGGTIILRHFWDPMIQSNLNWQEDSTTFYAYTKIWSKESGINNYWIGFNNLSRSTGTDSPLPNTWDDKNSAVWVNGILIDPPTWKQGGMRGDLELPMLDENYELRNPTRIFLNKGWNLVLIKCPVANFKAKDWQNPVKWMFTFVPSSN